MDSTIIKFLTRCLPQSQNCWTLKKKKKYLCDIKPYSKLIWKTNCYEGIVSFFRGIFCGFFWFLRFDCGFFKVNSMEGAIYYVCSAPPSIHSSSEAKLEAEKGQNVKMYCKGNGSPKPTVKWTRVVRLYELCKTDLPYE